MNTTEVKGWKSQPGIANLAKAILLFLCVSIVCSFTLHQDKSYRAQNWPKDKFLQSDLPVLSTGSHLLSLGDKLILGISLLSGRSFTISFMAEPNSTTIWNVQSTWTAQE